MADKVPVSVSVNGTAYARDVEPRDLLVYFLREDLGQTYTVGVDLAQPLPQRGEGHIQIRFGAAPENIEPMTGRVMQEIARLLRRVRAPVHVAHRLGPAGVGVNVFEIIEGEPGAGPDAIRRDGCFFRDGDA